MLNEFYFSIFDFHLRACEPIELPQYKGSALRGGFGHALKKTVCVIKSGDCQSCKLIERCVYIYIFDTKPPAESERLKKYTSIPHPFVILPPFDGKRLYASGDIFLFRMTLVGRAIDYLPYFIFAFGELGSNGLGKRRGRFEVDIVTMRNGGKPQSIYSSRDKVLKGYNAPLTSKDLLDLNSPTSITLRFLTPTRIKYEDRDLQ